MESITLQTGADDGGWAQSGLPRCLNFSFWPPILVCLVDYLFPLRVPSPWLRALNPYAPCQANETDSTLKHPHVDQPHEHPASRRHPLLTMLIDHPVVDRRREQRGGEAHVVL
jgi:hypothetical protein